MNRRRLSKKERLQVYEKCQGHCAYCGCELDIKHMQVEHVEPLSIGGTDTLDNMLPSCRSCNHYKSTLNLEDFRDWLGGLHSRMSRDSVNYRTLNRFKIVGCNNEPNKPIKFYFETVEQGVKK